MLIEEGIRESREGTFARHRTKLQAPSQTLLQRFVTQSGYHGQGRFDTETLNIYYICHIKFSANSHGVILKNSSFISIY